MATAIKRQRIFPGSKQLESPSRAAAEAKRKANPDMDEGDADYDADIAAHKAEVEKLDAKYKGTHTYQLTQPHYRLGVWYVPGELVSVTDEKPGKTWKKVSDNIETYEPPTALPDPRDAAKQYDADGKEVPMAIVTRTEVVSQGREVPGVRSENANAENEKRLAEEAAKGSNIKPTHKR